MERNVMHALAALRDELRDRRIFRRRLQQFDPAFADRYHCDLHLFCLDGFFAVNLQSKVFVKLTSLCQRLYRNAKMINAERHFNSFFVIPSETRNSYFRQLSLPLANTDLA